MKRNSAAALPRGLYAITPDNLQARGLLDAAAEVLAGGARVLQYRAKHRDRSTRLRDAKQLQSLCQRHGACFIINDDVQLAAEVAADGVHLGEDDQGLAIARRILGAESIIGVSCYDSLARAGEAQAAGADYLAFGAFFPSVSKQTRRRADLDTLRQAEGFGLPRVAIGGIRAENAGPLVAAGAHCVAVIDALWNAADRRVAAQNFARLFASAAR